MSKKCIQGYDFVIKKSAVGYYIGTIDEEGFSVCRCSGYYKTKMDANSALENKTFHRICEENRFCNGGKSCIEN